MGVSYSNLGVRNSAAIYAPPSTKHPPQHLPIFINNYWVTSPEQHHASSHSAPELARAPSCPDHDDHLILSVWRGRCSLPPLYSFQFYITYDISGSENSELEALAKRIHQKILAPDMAPKPLRFDIHFLGAQATTEHCIENYRQVKQALPDDPSARIVPSYECGDFCGYHSYLFKIPDPEWERGKVGMMRVAFDPAESDRFAMNRPVMEHRKTVDEVGEACSCLYKSPCSPKHFREDCESVYKLAKAAGLTEWICQSLRMSSVHDLPPFPITHQSSAHLALQRPCPPTLERKLAGVKLLAARSITTDTFEIMMNDPPLAPGAADAACHLSSHSRYVFLAHRKLFDSRSCHQLYVTYDVSEAETSDLETLAKELHNTLLDCNVNPIRFDLHFLRPDASTEDCVAH
ncbi:hypothetical protein HDK64DRAFT_254861 [Phyllosticta capitalensis]